MSLPYSGPIMLYDGMCGFCNGTVQMVIKLDRHEKIRFAALQSKLGETVRQQHPMLDKIDSVVIVEVIDGQEVIFVRSAAALRIVYHLGGLWRIFLIAKLIPTPIRDWGYDLIAKYRYKIFGKYESCMIPSPAVRSRFIDLA